MKKIILVLSLLVLGLLFFLFDLEQYLTLEYVKSQQQAIQALYADNRVATLIGFFIIYVVVTGASLPGATVLTLVAGAIFGLPTALVLVSFASTIGASIAFLVSRYLFRDAVQSRFGGSLKAINDGIDKDGPFYLFALRLVPAFPFFVINLVMGLTSLRLWTFFWVSQVGMLAGTVVYVNAGTQLAQIESASGIFSTGILVSFLLLAMLPFVGRKAITMIANRKALKGYEKPQEFDTNLVVIGAGSAGLVTAYIAAAVKAKVTLIEKDRMGGDCLNYGCVPSKALLRSAKLLSQVARSREYGIASASAEFDFAEVMERIQQVIRDIEPHDSVERYSALGVDVVQGEARITSPWSVEVDGNTIRTRNIVVATGGRPFVPPIEGIDEVDFYTSDNLWELRVQPQKMVVLGGGPIGCELTQAFARLGVAVTQIEMLPRILLREDSEVSELVQDKFLAEGVQLLTGHTAKRFFKRDGRDYVVAESKTDSVEIEFDTLIVAVGRAPRTSGFGLEHGRLLWEANAAVPRGRSDLERLVDIDGNMILVGRVLYVVTYQGRIVAIDALEGEVLWAKEMSSYAGISADERQIYVTDSDSNIWAVDRVSGDMLWKQDKLAYRQVTAPVSIGEYVLVGDFDGYIHILSRQDGGLIGRDRVDSDGFHVQPQSRGETVYIYGNGGTLSALRIN